MPRKGPAKKRVILPDPVYHNRLVTRFVNRMMLDGKKSLSETIFYRSLDAIETKTGRKGIEIFEQAVRNVMPQVEVKPRRVGGATYQVPMEIRADRKTSLALRWIVSAARRRNGKTMIDRLTAELTDAANNTGSAVRQREEKSGKPSVFSRLIASLLTTAPSLCPIKWTSTGAPAGNWAATCSTFAANLGPCLAAAPG